MFQYLAPRSPFGPPSLLYIVLTQPIKTLLRFLDFGFSLLRSQPQPGNPSIKVVCISDTHCLKASRIPDGDLLIHAGDLTNAGTPAEIQDQIDWLNSLPHAHKVAIAGNHDTYLDPRSRQTLELQDRKGQVSWKGIWYLQHSSITLKFHDGRRQIKVFGAPQIPACGGDEFAFQYQRGSDAWSETVPRDTDILVTHTPPKYHLDLPAALGCEHLLKETWKVQPRLHVFGHVHAGKSDTLCWLKGGHETVRWDAGQLILERVARRSDGPVLAVIDPRNWLDVMLTYYYGIVGLLWDRVWGGASPKATVMVNASLMFNDTGKLLNPPQVFEI